MKFTKIIVIILTLAVGFGLGFFTHEFLISKKTVDCTKDVCYQQGWNDLKQYVTKNISNNQVGEKLPNRNFINGKINQVGNNEIIVEYKPLELIPDANLMTRNVFVSNDTDIEKLVPKSDAVYQQEVSRYKQAAAAANRQVSPEEYPSKYEYASSTPQDLKVGQDIYVQAANDIQGAKNINATLIRILD